jgi:DNA replication and repair protein RecF
MMLRRLSLQTFRNLPLGCLDFDSKQTFFVGANGQGKTNLLEAVGLLGALRSFRGAEPRDLIARGATEARVCCVLEHERDGVVEVEILVRPQRREVSINGAKCERLAEFLGRFPVVALSSYDLQLLRGAPQLRRRAVDLAIASLDEKYFNALRRYHEALDSRNALLRGPRAPAAEELSAFEAQMAPSAAALVSARAKVTAELAAHFVAAYDQLTGGVVESPGWTYAPDLPAMTADVWCTSWADSRPRDLAMKTTMRGPHRDDFAFQLAGQEAKALGSEGQQRGLVVSWRLAQAAWQRARTGIAPIVLADDVLGELDPSRRAGFWRAAANAAQVLATGTTLPAGEAEEWAVWNVNAGAFERPTPNT